MTNTFDPNFCFPTGDLENDWVKLTPFNPAVHGDWFWEHTKDHPELYKYFPFGPYESKEEVIASFFIGRIQQNQGQIAYAVYDKVFESTPTPAGLIGLLETRPEHLSTEIGFVITFPRYQRTHLTSNMVGLLLQYCLELPENGGLGMRRVQWQAHVQNAASVRVSERMGFRYEGVKRWDRVIPASVGKPNTAERFPREGDSRKEDWGRHTALLALCWDDWEDGAREKVQGLMRPR